uniref:RING-type E3 ubiquitin transferase n=2 Tax=Latimeria chalumnae TaxID=7897 RepID=H3APB7_LATCH
MHERVNVVPFKLTSPVGCKTSVHVLSPLDASGLHLETVYERFHQPTHGFKDLLGHYLSGEKPKGFLEMEEMVKVGTSLTGIGELVLDSDRVIKLQPPKDGSEYFLSLAEWQTVLNEQEAMATVWKVLAAIFGLAGLAVLLLAARRVYQWYKEQQKREEQRRRFKEMSSGQDSFGQARSSTFLGEEEEEIPKNACVICLSQPRECVFLICGHVCCCFDCFRALPSQICPICRASIQRAVPLYQP